MNCSRWKLAWGISSLIVLVHCALFKREGSPTCHASSCCDRLSFCWMASRSWLFRDMMSILHLANSISTAFFLKNTQTRQPMWTVNTDNTKHTVAYTSGTSMVGTAHGREAVWCWVLLGYGLVPVSDGALELLAGLSYLRHGSDSVILLPQRAHLHWEQRHLQATAQTHITYKPVDPITKTMC